ncbi:ATP-dependent DNA helicase 2 subunit KU80 [Scaptodrosophila lebanonensis]|uniref:ATP-dependent DNA helicase 2 subunit KU80 n=1 Tax=Drosophila lebanonensis TaxID=7225 RepID=A0A6J2TBD2_DROLE|nr:ATP-dependent DNA helicase 2 subunit KU80 [Scaptodrosophila lebanonensis]
MATNKECLVVVLDVRNCATEEFKLKSVKCVSEILKAKLVSDRKDYVSFVLVGTERAENGIGCKNIVQNENPRLCSWQLLLDFYQFVNVTSSPCDDGAWLDGLAVAIDVFKNAHALRVAHKRILLLYDFNLMSQNYDNYKDITNQIVNADIELIVGTHNIAYIDNAESSQAQAIFKTSRKANIHELENQKRAIQLVSFCNATLCNFKEALSTVFKMPNQRPWAWNAKLHIGSKINISVQGIISIKNESNIKLKKCWEEAGEEMKREQKHFIKGTEVTPEEDDLISGYMLGGTAVPYDDKLMDSETKHAPGLHCVAFLKKNAIPDEYYCGESLYTLVHQKGNQTAARKLDALVRALHEQRRIMLCWKIYSVKLNTPRLVVLSPNELDDNSPATLSMLELSYHWQHHFWNFPALRTEKTSCTEQQFQAIDKLIDSMDLECTLRDTQQPRELRANDLLPFDQLPSIYEHNVMDILECKVLRKAGDDEKQFKDMLRDKRFVEIFWKVPEAIEQQAKNAAKALKKQFPLEHSNAWLEKLRAQQLAENQPRIKQERKNNVPEDEAALIAIDAVGLNSPAEDFQQLLQHKVRTLQHNTQRDAKFQGYAAQMRVVILTLLERSQPNLETLQELLRLYRNSCFEFNAFADYDQFAAEIKSKARDKNLREFWFKVMVDMQLGPLVIGEATLDTELRLRKYYNIEQWSSDEESEPQLIE